MQHFRLQQSPPRGTCQATLMYGDVVAMLFEIPTVKDRREGLLLRKQPSVSKFGLLTYGGTWTALATFSHPTLVTTGSHVEFPANVAFQLRKSHAEFFDPNDVDEEIREGLRSPMVKDTPLSIVPMYKQARELCNNGFGRSICQDWNEVCEGGEREKPIFGEPWGNVGYDLGQVLGDDEELHHLIREDGVEMEVEKRAVTVNCV